jgi:helicase MOV-10
VGNSNVVSLNQDLCISVKFNQPSPQRGRYEARLEIVFEEAADSRCFIISRSLKAIVGDASDHELLRPVAPYTRPIRHRRTAETEVVPGEQPLLLTRVKFKRKLPDAKISEALVSVLVQRVSTKQLVKKIRQSYLPKTFDKLTYSNFFTTLLWAEEHQQGPVSSCSAIQPSNLTRLIGKISSCTICIVYAYAPPALFTSK